MLVLITGASSGIGRAAARAFAKRGDTVVLIARAEDKLRELAREIGENAHVFSCDVSDEHAVAAMATQVIEKCGIPDVILNSAGAGQWKTLANSSPSDLRVTMNAPYFGAAFVSAAFINGMLQRGSGIFIHINSPVAKLAWRNAVGYAASRGALQSFHESLAQELAGTGLRSCQIVFGHVSSDYFINSPGSAEHMPWIDKLVRTVSPEECATVIVKTVDRPRNEVLHPFMLKLADLGNRLSPGLMRWMARL